eukprot:1156978-Pelagomonas_calceolata.AAC.12
MRSLALQSLTALTKGACMRTYFYRTWQLPLHQCMYGTILVWHAVGSEVACHTEEQECRYSALRSECMNNIHTQGKHTESDSTLQHDTRASLNRLSMLDMHERMSDVRSMHTASSMQHTGYSKQRTGNSMQYAHRLKHAGHRLQHAAPTSSLGTPETQQGCACFAVSAALSTYCCKQSLSNPLGASLTDDPHNLLQHHHHTYQEIVLLLVSCSLNDDPHLPQLLYHHAIAS